MQEALVSCKPKRVYHFDIYDQVQLVKPAFMEDWLEQETWQYYLEWILFRDCAINVVKTAELSSRISPFVNYMQWKLTLHAPLSDVLYIPELHELHQGDECWVRKDGTSLMLIYY